LEQAGAGNNISEKTNGLRDESGFARLRERGRDALYGSGIAD